VPQRRPFGKRLQPTAAAAEAQFAYNKGDTLSAEDRAIAFTICDGPGTGTSRTLGSYLDEGKALFIDKSFYG